MTETTTKDPRIVMQQDLQRLMSQWEQPNSSRALSPLDALFLYRLLLGRNPDAQELPRLLDSEQPWRSFLDEVLASPEFAYSSGYMPPQHKFMSDANGFRFWFDTGDREMGVQMGLGSYEPSTTSLLKRLVRPGMNCLDIGAQTGFYTCLMATATGPGGKVFAFEPMPQSYELLTRNIRENDFGSRVSAYQLACSDREHEIEGAFVSNMYVVGEVDAAEKVTMHAVPADDVVHERIDLVKIDIEGHEPVALRGMSRLLKDRPVIVSEANEYWLRTGSNSSAQEYVRQLMALGYDVYDIDRLDQPIQPAGFHLEILENMNLLALPAGKPLHSFVGGSS
jgi:FkbM family methyltransferase